MAKHKLSNRAKIILAVIREASVIDRDRDNRYFVPSAYPIYGNKMFPGPSIVIGGSGDARIIKSLINHGLAAAKGLAPYACVITPAGIEAYEALRTDWWVKAYQLEAKQNQEELDRQFNL